MIYFKNGALMTIIRQIQTFLFLFFTAFGSVQALALPSDGQQIQFLAYGQEIAVEVFDIENTARAPPLERQNVAITGAGIHRSGDVRALDCAETQWASLNFSVEFIAPNSVVDDAVDASTPVGRRTGFDDAGPDGVQPDGSGRQTPQYETFDNLPINQPTTIGGRDYSGHALDQMQNRGTTPSVVESTIKTGTPIPGNTLNEIEYVDTINGVNVVVDAATGRVVTVK